MTHRAYRRSFLEIFRTIAILDLALWRLIFLLFLAGFELFNLCKAPPQQSSLRLPKTVNKVLPGTVGTNIRSPHTEMYTVRSTWLSSVRSHWDKHRGHWRLAGVLLRSILIVSLVCDYMLLACCVQLMNYSQFNSRTAAGGRCWYYWPR